MDSQTLINFENISI